MSDVAIYALGDRVPEIDDRAFIHPDATIIGAVRIGARSSVWPHAVLRGDYGAIVVGDATSIQDCAVIHATRELDTTVGNWVVVGHQAHLEGCTVEDRALIGVGSVVLHRARIGEGATVGAGAVVTNDLDVPPAALAIGVPAVVKPGRSNAEEIARMAQVYLDNTRRYRGNLRRLD